MTDDSYFARAGESGRDANPSARAEDTSDDQGDGLPTVPEYEEPSPPVQGKQHFSSMGWIGRLPMGDTHPAETTGDPEPEQEASDGRGYGQDVIDPAAMAPLAADGIPSPRGEGGPLLPKTWQPGNVDDLSGAPLDRPDSHPYGGEPDASSGTRPHSEAHWGKKDEHGRTDAPAVPTGEPACEDEADEETEGSTTAEPPETTSGDAEPGDPARPAKQLTQDVAPGGYGFQADTQNFYGNDYVRPQPVSMTDLQACAEDRFVVPRDSRRWELAQQALAQYGVVVLCALPGNGRRTAALRLLSTVGPSAGTSLFIDLEPEWSKPDVTKLPVGPGHRYLLDLSEMPEPPGQRFGDALRDYGETGRVANRYLVVLATPQSWQGPWTEAARPFTMGLPSPDAKPLVGHELRRRGASHRISWLDDRAFEGIWESNPPAQDARRLAWIIQEAAEGDDKSAIVDEFRGWHQHIGALLSPSQQGPGEPTLVATRSMVWAGALLHGGTKRSVIQAADMLLDNLKLSREPVDVLSDATSSRRLEAAHLTPNGDHVFHNTNKHDLAPAILRHLWEEFPTQRELLRTWAVAVAADQSLPDNDARIVASSLLNLATEVHDNTIIDSIGRDLAEHRRSLAVEVLTSAALDPEIGRYVRNRLYRWMTVKKPPAELVALVTEICGGELALRQPAIAVTRLARAATHSAYSSQPMVEAFAKLSEVNPAEVAKALKTWLEEQQPKRHALVSFLALASSPVGARLLLDTTNERDGRARFVRAWQQLLKDDDAWEAADTQLTRWGSDAEKGELPDDQLIDLLADVYEPKIYRSSLKRFFARDEEFQQTFWGKILEAAVIRNHERHKEAAE